MTSQVHVVIHAPTATALGRARSNAMNLLKANPDAEIEIVTNGAGTMAAISEPDAQTDGLVLVCANTLKRNDREPPPHLRRVAAAVVHLVMRQQEGWSYIRA